MSKWGEFLDSIYGSWEDKRRRAAKRKAWLVEFDRAKPFLCKLVEAGELLYVYYNGYVLVNQPDIKGGIFNNNATLPFDEFLRQREGVAK